MLQQEAEAFAQQQQAWATEKEKLLEESEQRLAEERTERWNLEQELKRQSKHIMNAERQVCTLSVSK